MKRFSVSRIVGRRKVVCEEKIIPYYMKLSRHFMFAKFAIFEKS